MAYSLTLSGMSSSPSSARHDSSTREHPQTVRRDTTPLLLIQPQAETQPLMRRRTTQTLEIKACADLLKNAANQARGAGDAVRRSVAGVWRVQPLLRGALHMSSCERLRS